jgi:hypothetical protein
LAFTFIDRDSAGSHVVPHAFTTAPSLNGRRTITPTRMRTGTVAHVDQGAIVELAKVGLPLIVVGIAFWLVRCPPVAARRVLLAICGSKCPLYLPRNGTDESDKCDRGDHKHKCVCDARFVSSHGSFSQLKSTRLKDTGASVL